MLATVCLHYSRLKYKREAKVTNPSLHPVNKIIASSQFKPFPLLQWQCNSGQGCLPTLEWEKEVAPGWGLVTLLTQEWGGYKEEPIWWLSLTGPSDATASVKKNQCAYVLFQKLLLPGSPELAQRNSASRLGKHWPLDMTTFKTETSPFHHYQELVKGNRPSLQHYSKKVLIKIGWGDQLC